mgnify:CR=1 FL=1
MAIITKDTKEGYEACGKPKVLAEERVWAFSGGAFRDPQWPRKNIHTDLEFAKNCGSPTRAVSATQYMGHLAELMIGLFGEKWFKQGKMSLKFIAIVDVGDRLFSKAIVRSKEKEGGGIRFNLEVWCENQHGNKVAVGSASCLV